MQNTDTMTDTTVLNSLLRGEMSAIETYRQAIEKFSGETGVDQLHSFQKDHSDAADLLWKHVEKHGGKPVEGSGAWGTFAQAVEGTAKLFGSAAALKALKEGEEHGLKEYQGALDGADLAADCRELLLSFVPKMRQHVQVLDGLISKV